MACCGKNKKKSAPVLPSPKLTTSKRAQEDLIQEEITPLVSASRIHDYPRARLAICNLCDKNNVGICEEQKLKTPDRPCLVEIGIELAEAECPKGVWPKHIPEEYSNKNICSKCGRVHDYAAIICKHCTYQLERVRRNLDKGIGHNPGALRLERQKLKDGVRVVDHTIQRSPFDKQPIKNLHYFIYPRYEESIEYHIDQLRRSVSLFNGKRVCCVATDKYTLEEKYKSQLDELFTEVYYLPNSPRKRERVGFISTLDRLITTNPNEVICFAHAKGQQYHTKTAPVIRKWNDAMYDTCVRNWKTVEKAMEAGYPVAGSFKSLRAFKTTKFSWHYSGSFWWARSYKLFHRNWRVICQKWWGTESYVGRHFSREEGYCLFHQLDYGSLYETELWQSLDLELEKWRTDNELSERLASTS